MVTEWQQTKQRLEAGISAEVCLPDPPVTSECGISKTVKTRFWPWLAGKNYSILSSCSLFARKRSISLRLIDFVYHSTLGLRVIKKKKGSISLHGTHRSVSRLESLLRLGFPRPLSLCTAINLISLHSNQPHIFAQQSASYLCTAINLISLHSTHRSVSQLAFLPLPMSGCPRPRCRADMTHTRQLRPDYGLDFQVKVLQTF